MANVDNSENVLDSRDIIARLEELESQLQDTYDTAYPYSEEGTLSPTFEDWMQYQLDTESLDAEDVREYQSLKALCEEAEGYSEDWQYGATLIRENYFTEYAQELAEDIGAITISKDNQWPLNHVDWEAAAEELKSDYTEVDFNGVTYYVR